MEVDVADTIPRLSRQTRSVKVVDLAYLLIEKVEDVEAE